MKITRFEDIDAWKLGRELRRCIYEVVNDTKFSKDYGLRDQICRASVSVMSNIAEGFNSGSNAEFVRFLSYAQRSCSEVQSQLYIALDQKYISKELFDNMYDLSGKTGSKIGAFIKYLMPRRVPRARPWVNASRSEAKALRLGRSSEACVCGKVPRACPWVSTTAKNQER